MSLFIKPKKKINVRKKLDVDEGEDDESSSTCIEDIRELQKTREKKNGLTEIECAVGKEKAAALEDGIQMAGGTMAMSGKQKARLEAADIEAGIRDQFEKETLLRDEHEELRKFIDAGLAAKDGKPLQEAPAADSKGENKMENEVLMRAASTLNRYRSETASELLSEHMLAGIPEVDLGISARISNIVQTEQKKKELIEEAITGKKKEKSPDAHPQRKRRRY